MIVVDTNEIAKLNEGLVGKRLSPVELKTGEWVINEDLLTDEKTWGFAFDYLKSCPKRDVQENEFVKPEFI